MKEKKDYKSVLLVVLTFLVAISVFVFVEPQPWATISDPLQEQVQCDVLGHSRFNGINTPWCCEWTSGL